MEENKLNQLENNSIETSPLALAYIGDAVYELFVRRYMVEHYNVSQHELNKKTIALVNAKAQAQMLKELGNILTEEEVNIVKRGRNTKANTVPRHTSPIQYKYATGFEALIGYLYLNKRIDRLNYILNFCLNKNFEG